MLRIMIFDWIKFKMELRWTYVPAIRMVYKKIKNQKQGNHDKEACLEKSINQWRWIRWNSWLSYL